MTAGGPGLAATVWGSGERVVLAHGFTHNALTWGPFASGLAERFEVVAVDLPGHGASGALRADLPASAELLGRRGGAASYVGYSLGARVCLHLAVARPELVRRLVLIGAHPGIVDPARRAARRIADARLADELDPPGADPIDASTFDAFLARWLTQPLFATLAPDAAGLEHRRANDPVGLAESLRRCGTGTQRPLWDRLGALAMPVLLVVGGRDDKFRALADEMVGRIGDNAALYEVADAGHACHLERPGEVAEAVGAFLAG